MTSPWARDLTEGPITDLHPANWPRDGAGEPYAESERRRLRGLSESEDDPRAEFVGAYLDREI